MINNARILKENVLINLNYDVKRLEVWKEEEGIIYRYHTIIIPMDAIGDEIDLNAIDKEFFDGVHTTKISKTEVSLFFSQSVSNHVVTIKEMYKEINNTVRDISTILDKFNINDYRLICDFYSEIE
ncbi:hypothetical protein [Clostridium gasigenes]|uniref:Uncharacterized protein n=1 Tax=Clostridium gasigenes TaxID=94869 RepID=A0A1H0V3K2_9CLOT|nr:hypothetical protein [Clostridium gasigenes]SDP73030.1 hypothetical protein SAMN04488529_11426 [Clostridium gasigenes]